MGVYLFLYFNAHNTQKMRKSGRNQQVKMSNSLPGGP